MGVAQFEFGMEVRDAPPAHLLVKIQQFSKLLKHGIQEHESREFVAGEYKWKLIIYGRDCNNEDNRISVYLSVADADTLPEGWKVKANCSIFLHNQISDNYLCYQVKDRCFDAMNSKWGFSISKRMLAEPYLVDDKCVFGAEVFLSKTTTSVECLSLFDCKISDLSQLKGGINELPDDLLINILSHTRLKEAARTSVLAHRWRYLWRYVSGILQFGNRDTASGQLMKKENFESWVNTVVKLHQGRYIEGIVIRLEGTTAGDWIKHTTYDRWVYFATRKDVQMLKVNLPLFSCYRFPSVETLVSNSGVIVPLCRLKTLRLANIDIEDEVAHYFLGSSCPNLEEFCIRSSSLTSNLRVIDPPRLRVLEISRCKQLQSLKISAPDLVSLTYNGPREILLLEKIPNLRESTVRGAFSQSFVTEPWLHSYLVHLEKLVVDFRLLVTRTLEDDRFMPELCSLKRLEVFAAPGRTTTFYYRLLIKASPQLREFRIESCYGRCSSESCYSRSGEDTAMVVNFVHRNLKVVEIGGYTGRLGEDKLVQALLKIGPLIERVVIDTKINYFDFDWYVSVVSVIQGLADCPRQTKTARNRAKIYAKSFGCTIPPQIKFIVT